MIYLSPQQVLFTHARVIAETGGTPGVGDLGLLEGAVARPQATFEGQDLYPDVAAKAAALMESLSGNHPFVDGNKRVAIASAGIFLRLNGLRLTATNQELEDFTMAVAERKVGFAEIEAWFREFAYAA